MGTYIKNMIQENELKPEICKLEAVLGRIYLCDTEHPIYVKVRNFNHYTHCFSHTPKTVHTHRQLLCAHTEGKVSVTVAKSALT